MSGEVFIFIEQERGKLADVSLELVSKGRELAQTLNTKVSSVLLGDNVANLADTLFHYGSDKVFLIQDEVLKDFTTMPYSRTIVDLVKKEEPQIMLFGASPVGRDLAPRVSASLKCGLTADCTKLTIENIKFRGKELINQLLQVRPAFGGNIIATIISPNHRPQMATVREGVMKKLEPDNTRTGELINIPFVKHEKDEFVKIIQKIKETSSFNLKLSEIIVAGGAGVKSKANFELIKELAEVLGGEVGPTRSAVDFGYVKKQHQVGQTGITVRPKLYIACGISGAIQHKVGMDQSDIIISINSDPDAPIFKYSHYGIVGDLAKVLPMFIEVFKSKKNV